VAGTVAGQSLDLANPADRLGWKQVKEVVNKMLGTPA
jgi:hypothetical protein